MVAAGQAGQRAGRHAKQAKGDCHGPPGHIGFAPQQYLTRVRRRLQAACQAGIKHGRRQQRHDQPTRHAPPQAFQDIAHMLRVGIRQMRGGAAQAREIAHRLVVHQHGFLQEQLRGQGLRVVSFRLRQHRTGQEAVQRGLHHGRINGRGIGGGPWRGRQLRAVVNRVQQPHHGERGQDDGRAHGGRIARHAPPGGAQVRAAAHMPQVGQRAQHHEPQRDVGPQEDDLGHGGYSNRTRGSASV
ncbi:hypothetical protein D3C86_1469760 [compost metagenome]